MSTPAGKAPRSLQIWMPSLTDTAQELLLLIHYPPGSAALRHTWLPGQGFRPHPEPAPPAIGDGSLHGAYYWDPMAAVLYVKMRGGAPNEDLPGVTVELRTEPTAMVSGCVGLTLHSPPFYLGYQNSPPWDSPGCTDCHVLFTFRLYPHVSAVLPLSLWCTP